MPTTSNISHVETISEHHRDRGLVPPKHPLISLINLSDMRKSHSSGDMWWSYGFYAIFIKRGLKSKVRYGHTSYDFDEGVLALLKPHQVFGRSPHPSDQVEGWALFFSSELLEGYPLSEKILSHGFFSYQLNEALHLSQQEEKSLLRLMQQIESEYKARIDSLTQDVIIASLDLLLTYVDRYYKRQFVTRKTPGYDILSKLDTLLESYIEDGEAYTHGLPSIAVMAEKMGVSSNYLNDLVKSLSGKSFGNYIDLAVLQRAKLKLSLSNKSISTIAYELGFQHSQSFNRFFKKHEQKSPGEYRKSLN
ncbi:helix-turn-helix domain-containing protein [Marinomonas sp. THO17]|uniref:helix-turn-helix domain-containing protein n=1 Tax=Marinomonas sp. THO17 TaxID=3149048 RepID=UPI00336BAEF8